jgi:hypothetical protein
MTTIATSAKGDDVDVEVGVDGTKLGVGTVVDGTKLGIALGVALRPAVSSFSKKRGFKANRTMTVTTTVKINRVEQHPHFHVH